MIHQYKNNGYDIVMDVNSGAIHVVDDVVYDAIAMLEEKLGELEKPQQIPQEMSEEVRTELVKKYSIQDIDDAMSDIQELINAEELFTRDVYRDFVMDFKKRKTVVKALCLHIAHDCNLACRYCFAEEGEYHGRRALMSFEVGKKALDFLIANSGNRVNLEVDFFGGEPLMNWDVVKQLVEYGRSQEAAHNKKFRFTLTTNGVLLNDEIMEFCNREMSNVVLSLDGRKEVNDKMRPFRKGAGSYDIIVPKFQMFQKLTGWGRGKMTVYVLCGFDTTLEQDLDRIYTLRDLGYAPYVMIYDKYKLKKRDQLKRMQRWVNSRYAFMACERFEDYTG